jgi:drug/metabolite transporter (DMT)-like permease
MDIRTVIGVVCGFFTAVLMASSYYYSRHFLSLPGRNVRQLVVLSHLWMGLFAVILLSLVWRAPEQPGGAVFGTVFMVLGYLTAQIFFFITVRFVPASRLAPLLNAKVIMVALLSWLILREEATPLRLAGAALALVAVALVQKSGERVPRKGLLNVLVICAAFACSDIAIRHTTQSVSTPTTFRGSQLALALLYLGCLPLAAIAYVWIHGRGPTPWLAALGYALIWFGSSILLFISIAFIGVVPAILLQALRGPLSVMFSPLIARLGWHHLEMPQSPGSILRQLGAALMTVVAFALYLAG